MKLKELLINYGLDNRNYKKWRKEHSAMFGELFSAAFIDSEEAQIHLTAALIKISKRDFNGAIPKLGLLTKFCTTTLDYAAINYFMGLNYEFLENEHKMNEHYERFMQSGISFLVNSAFHPYYRTAKFAQRDSECEKALFYYKKSLSFCEQLVQGEAKSTISGQIIYDIATLCLYMHRYEECEEFLKISETYDPSEKPHRIYVSAIRNAAIGDADKAKLQLDKLSGFLYDNCQSMVDAILSKKDLHYCIVKQNESAYNEFWDIISQNKDDIERLVAKNNTNGATEIISQALSKALAFMQRKIACRIETTNDELIVYCKNYYVKTLTAEYEVLFSKKPEALSQLNFVSVNEFEKY